MRACIHIHACHDQVRLVLDVGGAVGGFGRALHRKYGDRIVTTTANRYVEDSHHLVYPFAQYIAARGFPSVVFDKDSFFPFADSTFDLIHSSWSYHSGFSRVTLFEFYRVLRPGGFLVLRAIASSRHTLDRVLAFALEHGWVCHRRWCSIQSVSDNYLWCQVPGY